MRETTVVRVRLRVARPTPAWGLGGGGGRVGVHPGRPARAPLPCAVCGVARTVHGPAHSERAACAVANSYLFDDDPVSPSVDCRAIIRHYSCDIGYGLYHGTSFG